MAKIEIKGTPEELERITIFLKTNNIKHGSDLNFFLDRKEGLWIFALQHVKYSNTTLYVERT